MYFFIALMGFLYWIGEGIRDTCKKQETRFEKMRPNQEIEDCRTGEMVRRVPGGLLITSRGGFFGGNRSTFVPMKFEDEQ